MPFVSRFELAIPGGARPGTRLLVPPSERTKSRAPLWKPAAAAAGVTLGLFAFAGFQVSGGSARLTLSAPFERKVLVPPGEAPLNLRLFTGAVKTDSRGNIITGPTSDLVKHLVGAEPAGERGGMPRYTKILF